jgi:hypothetical protein
LKLSQNFDLPLRILALHGLAQHRGSSSNRSRVGGSSMSRSSMKLIQQQRMRCDLIRKKLAVSSGYETFECGRILVEQAPDTPYVRQSFENLREPSNVVAGDSLVATSLNKRGINSCSLR